MDDILDAIETALKRKGLSAAAASRLAVGNSSLIKNMRADDGETKRYNAQALTRLAQVLDLEFYFGTPRTVTSLRYPAGFAEDTLGTDDGDPGREALHEGFLPIPYHSAASPQFRGTAPVALARKWLAARDLDPAHLTFLPVLDDAMAAPVRPGALLLVDAGDTSGDGAGLWSASHRGALICARLSRPAPDLLAVTQDNRALIVLRGDAQVPFRILGRVVWVCGAAA